MNHALRVKQQLAIFGTDSPKAWSDLTNTNKLCHRCATIDWDNTRLYLTITDEPSIYPRLPLYAEPPLLHEIREASHAGCHLCTLIMACLLSMRYRYSIGVDPIPEGLESIGDDTPVQVSVELYQAIRQGDSVEMRTWLTVGIEDQGSLRGWLDTSTPVVAEVPRREGALTYTSAATDIASHWLNECLNGHTKCMSIDSKSPKRLIDVSNPDLLFLQEDLTNVRYAALSYKIGGISLAITTSASLASRKAGFAITELTQTVQDAVWWTRKLHLTYLWIDSLCILQDNLSDWEVELSSMADVYFNATIVLAAAASSNASSGCLPTQNKLAKSPCVPTLGVCILPDFDRDRWIHSKGQLDTRAWTFQEVQLGTRVLRVGSEELAWQCRTCKRREVSPLLNYPHNTQSTGFTHGSRALDAKRMMSQNMFRAWYMLARDFNSRDISFSADRLPAFSGMAAYFSTELHATYVCGLWKEDLHHGLLWRCMDPGVRPAYRAPSWSWVALEGHQLVWAWELLELKEEHQLFHILETHVVVQGLNPYGRVTGGKIVLSGPVVPFPSTVCGNDSESGTVNKIWKWPNLTLDTDCVPGPGSLLLRLYEPFCLVLEPMGMARDSYRRIGCINTPSVFSGQPGNRTIDALDTYHWTEQVLSIV